MTESRRDALLRLLEDWEAERMTINPGWPRHTEYDLLEDDLMKGGCVPLDGIGWWPTPAGLAAARAIREEKDG